MLFGCEQPLLWGERCVTSQKTAAKETTSHNDASENRNPMIVPKGRSFKMACLNITSLTKHIDEVRTVLSNQCVDILAIN